MKWGLGRKAQWLVEKLNAEHLLGVAQLAPIRVAAGRRKRFEFSRAALAISAEEARACDEESRNRRAAENFLKNGRP
jgi:hypothetical protein